MTWREQIIRHADEYRRCAEITGAGKYPRDNRCHRCTRTSDRTLVPFPTGWRCRGCTYGKDTPHE